MMKCQKCPKAATLHITEIVSEEQVEELHLCEECAHKYLYEPQAKSPGAKTAPSGHAEEADEPAVLNQRMLGVRHQVRRFPQHRPARLPPRLPGIPRRAAPLLENIHGETRHCGKTPAPLAAEQADADAN